MSVCLTSDGCHVHPVSGRRALGLEINWNKTKIQASDIIVDAPPDVTSLDHKVDVVDSFVYLGSSVDASGGNDSDIRRRIELAHTCTKSLDQGIWRSSISLVTKLRFNNVYILPVLLYGSDTWSDRRVETAS